VVISGQLDELSAGDEAGGEPAFSDGNPVVTSNVEDKCWNPNLPRIVGVIDQVIHFANPHNVVGRTTGALKFVKAVLDVQRGIGQKAGGEEVAVDSDWASPNLRGSSSVQRCRVPRPQCCRASCDLVCNR
jgi:hypothetical protein